MLYLNTYLLRNAQENGLLLDDLFEFVIMKLMVCLLLKVRAIIILFRKLDILATLHESN